MQPINKIAMNRKNIKQVSIVNEGKIYNTFVNVNIFYNNSVIQDQDLSIDLNVQK